jgi:hypothetical protein
MKTLLFVHGTGVRAKAFEATTRALQNELNARSLEFSDYRLGGCYWGEQCGVKLPVDPKSVPDYVVGEQPTVREQELAKWLTLRCDPYFELRETVRQEGAWEPVGAERKAPCGNMPAVIAKIPLQGDLKNLLEYHSLTDAFKATIQELAASGALKSLCNQLKPRPGTIILMFARMTAARTLARAEADSAIQVDGMVRDRLADLLIAPLGGRAGAVKEVFGAVMGTLWPLLGPGIRWATTATRCDLTNNGSPVAGDIVAYQGRSGPAFRKRISEDIENAPTGEVALVAHSLGGIACVDLLIERSIPKVTHLITVGSQAPFLYEMDALCSLKYGTALPAHFPRNWMNVYDRHDILGYRALDVFPNSSHVFVKDLEIDTGEPFPQAHGAYWTRHEFWEGLKGFLKRP